MNINEVERKKQKLFFFNIVIFILIIFMAIRLPLDTDYWWHLRAGQLSVENQIPITQDLTSFSAFGKTWINHSWLAQVLLFLVYKFSGHTGVMIFVAMVATLSMLFVYLRLKANPLIKAFSILLCVLTTAVIWSPRPQLLSLLFFSILSFLIYEKEIYKSKKFAILIILLFFFWGNLHAGFSIGILLLVTYVLGQWMDQIFINETNTTSTKRELLALVAILLISALVVMINPNGINAWKVQFSTISIPSLQNLIPEWASPDFHELYQQPFLWLWLLLVFLFMANRSKFSFSEIIPLIVLGGLGFLSRRNYVYFAIYAIPILSGELQKFFEIYIRGIFSNSKYLKGLGKLNKEPKYWVSKGTNLIFVSLLLFVTIGKIVYLGSPIIFTAYEENIFPKRATNFLRDNNLTQYQCLNSYKWGGYSSWNVPEMKIFIDGRTDLYGEKIIQDWISMVNAETTWKEDFDTYRIDCIFLEKDVPIIETALETSWEIVYEDKISMILIKP